jgi:hypothetical protein
LLAVAVAPLPGQSLWLDRRADEAVGLEILKPNFDGNANTSLVTSTLMLSGRHAVGGRVRFVWELPAAIYGDDFQDEATIGDPYLGLEIRSSTGRVFGELGVRAPLASEDKDAARFTGMFTDLDRWDAFAVHFVPLKALVNYRSVAATGLVARVGGGPAFWISTQSGTDSEVMLHYNGQLGYESRQASMIAGVSGVAILSESDVDLGERTLHQLGAAASFGAGRLRPGVQLRVPLDNDLTGILDFVVGLHLTVALP